MKKAITQRSIFEKNLKTFVRFENSKDFQILCISSDSDEIWHGQKTTQNDFEIATAILNIQTDQP